MVGLIVDSTADLAFGLVEAKDFELKASNDCQLFADLAELVSVADSFALVELDEVVELSLLAGSCATVLLEDNSSLADCSSDSLGRLSSAG